MAIAIRMLLAICSPKLSASITRSGHVNENETNIFVNEALKTLVNETKTKRNQKFINEGVNINLVNENETKIFVNEGWNSLVNKNENVTKSKFINVPTPTS